MSNNDWFVKLRDDVQGAMCLMWPDSPSCGTVYALRSDWLKRLRRRWTIYTLCANNPHPSYYQVGGGWGDRITYIDEDRVVGWKSRRPVPGDVLETPKGEMLMYNIQYKEDPWDMFYAYLLPRPTDRRPT